MAQFPNFEYFFHRLAHCLSNLKNNNWISFVICSYFFPTFQNVFLNTFKLLKLIQNSKIVSSIVLYDQIYSCIIKRYICKCNCGIFKSPIPKIKNQILKLTIEFHLDIYCRKTATGYMQEFAVSYPNPSRSSTLESTGFIKFPLSNTKTWSLT